MANKKISFGFSKTVKKNELMVKKEKSLELIDCLEGKSIKIRGAVEEVKQPLVIPIRTSNRDLFARIRNGARSKAENGDVNKPTSEPQDRPDSDLTLDELAALELIKDAQNRESKVTTTTKVFTLPVTEKLIIEGEVEPTLDDYESIPISDYGMAMLRGMGWKEGQTIGKNPSKTVNNVAPELRPKGLGLGANKLVKANTPKQAVDKEGKELMLVKGAFAKIIAGARKGHYCEVEGLDDENCRIIVRTTLTKEVLSLNEFLVVPVTKEEYVASSKVINSAKYEEYKEKSDKKLKMMQSQSPEIKKERKGHSPEVRKQRKSHSPEIKEERCRTPEVKERRRGDVNQERSRIPKKERKRSPEVKRERSRSLEVKQEKASGSNKKDKSSSLNGNDDHRKRGSDTESDSDYDRKRRKHKLEKQQSESLKSHKKKSKKKSKHRDSDHEKEKKKKSKKSRHQNSDSDRDKRDKHSSRRKDGRS